NQGQPISMLRKPPLTGDLAVSKVLDFLLLAKIRYPFLLEDWRRIFAGRLISVI
ncbi:MAG: hypothetical protein RL242_2958, partial [Pseudomonadota bacterium]